MARRVYLHIGAPKTGTTYLQQRLVANRDSLKAHGVTLPTKSRLSAPEMLWFRASLDVLGQDWGGPPGHANGSWDSLVRRVARASDHVIVSHEILAPASAEVIARIAHDLRRHELHVVYSARDLARQLPAAWQESIKQGRRWSYAKFLKRYQSGHGFFARALDLPTVLDRWREHVPAERIRVVTLPVDGTGKLWPRMCRALAIKPAWAPQTIERANQSLSAAETAVLRELNVRLVRKTRADHAYDELVLHALGKGFALKRADSLTLPPTAYPWVERVAQSWMDYLGESPIKVIGELSDLRPLQPPAEQPFVDPDRIPAKRRLGPAMAALAMMTTEAARREEAIGSLGKLARAGSERLSQ